MNISVIIKRPVVFPIKHHSRRISTCSYLRLNMLVPVSFLLTLFKNRIDLEPSIHVLLSKCIYRYVCMKSAYRCLCIKILRSFIHDSKEPSPIQFSAMQKELYELVLNPSPLNKTGQLIHLVKAWSVHRGVRYPECSHWVDLHFKRNSKTGKDLLATELNGSVVATNGIKKSKMVQSDWSLVLSGTRKLQDRPSNWFLGRLAWLAVNGLFHVAE